MTDLTLKINAKLQPVDRHDIEDILEEIFEKNKLGEISGGGTAQMPSGEIEYCDIEITLEKDSKQDIDMLVDIVNSLGLAKGSKLYNDEINIPVGDLEGLAIYLNGTDLPDEVYENSDINFVVDELERLLGDLGRMYSHWAGATETAIYLEGISFVEMKKAIDGFLTTYPLCQKARIVKIA